MLYRHAIYNALHAEALKTVFRMDFYGDKNSHVPPGSNPAKAGNDRVVSTTMCMGTDGFRPAFSQHAHTPLTPLRLSRLEISSMHELLQRRRRHASLLRAGEHQGVSNARVNTYKTKKKTRIISVGCDSCMLVTRRTSAKNCSFHEDVRLATGMVTHGLIYIVHGHVSCLDMNVCVHVGAR